MNSFELNKIMGAVLGTLLFVMGAGFVADAIYHPIEGRGPGYALPEPEATELTAEAGPAEAAVPLGVLLASADATRGAAAVRKCQSCHNFAEGEGNKTGPHLYGIVGRPEGAVEDFAYSEALVAHNAAGDVWSYENLDAFLTSPRDYAPGTKMNFGGVRTPEERADILAYLQTLSPDPVPFPAADVAPTPAEEGAEPQAEQQDVVSPDAADPTDPATTAPENVTVPVAPDAAVETPEETMTESPVVGTPTTSGTPATTQVPANPMAPTQAPAPQTPVTPETPAAAQ
jgi:cytochrome c